MLTPEQRRVFERTFTAAVRTKAPHLTEPAWKYEPYPGRFEAHYCVYCGERARTYDAITNKLYSIVGEHRDHRAYLLVAACHDCQHYLNQGELPYSNMNKRRYVMLVELRRRYLHSKGPRSGTPKLVLNRRIQYIMRNMPTGDDRQKVGCRAPKPIYSDSRLK